MSNADKGNVVFTVDEKEYILRFDFNAFCELEELFERPIHKILEIFSDEVPNVGMREIRKFMHAGLIANQPDMDLEQCGKLIHEMGGFNEAHIIIVKGISNSFAESDKKPAKKKVKNKAGSGKNS